MPLKQAWLSDTTELRSCRLTFNGEVRKIGIPKACTPFLRNHGRKATNRLHYCPTLAYAFPCTLPHTFIHLWSVVAVVGSGGFSGVLNVAANRRAARRKGEG